VTGGTVADVVIQGLQRAGTRRIFAEAGASDSAVIDAAYHARLPVTFAHNEGAACVMAAVTGELVEAPGAVVVGSPLTDSEAALGLVHAFVDHSPLIVIAPPAVPSADAAPREVDGKTPFVKAALTIEPGSASEQIARATCLALAEPCGPVLLELADTATSAAAQPISSPPRPAALPAPESRWLDGAAQIIARASRPVLIAGRQCRTDETAKWLRALAEALPAPVLVSPKAKGVFPDPHPLHLGVVTGVVTGDMSSPGILERADLIVAVGTDPIELPPEAVPANVPTLRLSSSPAGVENRSGFEVIGDIALIIEELAPRLRGRGRADWDVAELDRIKRIASRRSPAGPGLLRHRVVQIARELTPAGTLAAVEGRGRLAAITFWDAVAPREFLISNHPGPMGFAVPAAIAARLACPQQSVVCFTEPESLGTGAIELETAARLGLPIVVVLVADGSTRAHAERLAVTRSAGIAAAIADSEATFRSAMSGALASTAPTLVVAHVEDQSTV